MTREAGGDVGAVEAAATSEAADAFLQGDLSATQVAPPSAAADGDDSEEEMEGL